MEKVKILIVEDEAIIAMAMEGDLHRLGYEVTSKVDTGGEAIKKAKEDKPDIVLMDIVLKDKIDGIEAADIIKTKFGIPVIFSTAFLDEKRIERAKITMPFGYIMKPIRDRDLKVTIEMALYVSKVDSERKKIKEALIVSESRIKRKLDAILSPEGNVGLLNLADIIEVQEIQSMMDDFFKFSNFLFAVLDINGKVLVSSGWQDICVKFHRTHSETAKNCTESDTILSKGVQQGEFKLYKCKNNLWDISTPIIIGGKHLGNIYFGQFFFDDEIIDREVFISQAQKYGFNQTDYLAALDKVPRLSRETVDHVMSFYSKFATTIAKLAYSNIKLARALNKNGKIEKN